VSEVGRSLPKIDGVGLVMGRPAYADDLAPRDALIVKALRSPHAFARIVSIDTSAAAAMPGVHCVLTWRDVPRVAITRAGQGHPEPSPRDRFILDEFVRHVGDEAAAVAAATEAEAEAALAAIVIEYEVLDPVLDFEMSEGHASVLHPEPEAHENFPIGFDPAQNVASAYAMNVADVDAVVAGSEVVLRRTYYTQAQQHVALEPMACSTWLDLHGRLNVISSTQTPWHVRRIMARALDVPVKDIRVNKPRIGGGFGGKQMIHGELLCGLATLRTGRPTKMVYSRREVFDASNTRHPMRLDMTVGADRDGRLRAIDMKVLSDTGAYGEHALTVFMIAGAKTLPLYNKVDAVRFGGKTVYTNRVPGGAFRGYGAIQGNYALESVLAELAHELGLDPIALREMNMIGEGETSPIFAIMGEGTEGRAQTVDSCKLPECIRRGREMIGWDDKYPRRDAGPDKVRGVGMALAMQGSGIPGIDMASATLKLNDFGSFNLLIGATDLGTGSDTILAQIAADVLGVTTDKIIVYSSDTDRTPFDTGAYASSTTYVSGHAVREAAALMKAALVEEGARSLGCNPSDVDFDGKTVRGPDGEISLEDLSTRLLYSEHQKQLCVTGSHLCEKSPPPYMAGFAEVDVDTATGLVTLVDYVAIVDCGNAINPNLAKVQVEGGLAQGVGMALTEDVRYGKRGHLRTNDMMSYKIPSREDLPSLRVELVDSHEPSGPYGAKSVGEIGIDTPPAAIANAVFNAVGVRIRDLPITPEKVLAALDAKGKKE
jgi:putative selenate reductase molybdopterin-binding subunit